MTRLNRNQVVEVLRLVCCENLICQREEFIFDAFIYFAIRKTSVDDDDDVRQSNNKTNKSTNAGCNSASLAEVILFSVD